MNESQTQNSFKIAIKFLYKKKLVSLLAQLLFASRNVVDELSNLLQFDQLRPGLLAHPFRLQKLRFQRFDQFLRGFQRLACGFQFLVLLVAFLFFFLQRHPQA